MPIDILYKKGECFIVMHLVFEWEIYGGKFCSRFFIEFKPSHISQISANIGLDDDNYTYEIACIKTIAAQIERLERMKTEETERQAKTTR